MHSSLRVSGSSSRGVFSGVKILTLSAAIVVVSQEALSKRLVRTLKLMMIHAIEAYWH